MKVAHTEAELLKLLDAAGLAADALDAWEAWKAFKQFLQLRVDNVYDAASFQCGTSANERGGEAFYASFTRQFSEWEGTEDVGLRQIVMEFEYRVEHIADRTATELWTHDFPSIPAFASVVEAQPQFQAMCNARPQRTEVWSEEL